MSRKFRGGTSEAPALRSARHCSADALLASPGWNSWNVARVPGSRAPPAPLAPPETPSIVALQRGAPATSPRLSCWGRGGSGAAPNSPGIPPRLEAHWAALHVAQTEGTPASDALDLAILTSTPPPPSTRQVCLDGQLSLTLTVPSALHSLGKV